MSGVLLIACGEATAPTPRQKPVSAGASGSVVRMPTNAHFHEQMRYTIMGQRVPNSRDACLFDRIVHLKPGQHVFERVIEFDMASCAFVIARGTDDRYMGASPGTASSSKIPPVTSMSMQTTVDTLTGSGSGSIVGPAGPEQPTAAARMASNPVFWMRMLHEDPAGIGVTVSEHTLKLFTNTRCINSALSIHQPWWYSDSGWGPPGHTHGWNGRTCSYYDAFSIHNFVNYTFCLSITTYVFYQPNEIKGYSDGTADFRDRGYASGGCSSWLTYYVEYFSS